MEIEVKYKDDGKIHHGTMVCIDTEFEGAYIVHESTGEVFYVGLKKVEVIKKSMRNPECSKSHLSEHKE